MFGFEIHQVCGISKSQSSAIHEIRDSSCPIKVILVPVIDPRVEISKFQSAAIREIRDSALRN